ncbi:MAG: SCO family protein [Methylotenera sp.]|nr:MAG: SCO family protein [Methylotenera sp.]
MKKLLLASLVLFLSACNPNAQSGSDNKAASFVGTDITGADFLKPLALTDHNGKMRTMSDFKGKVVTLFFGYTHCPDVCPTTMVDLKQTMKLLGAKSDEVQVIFVTVDPQRDTQEVLAQFVPSFDPRFIGLWGSLQETAETLGNFKIYYSKVENKAKTDYTIDHSAGMYVFDKTGKIRLYLDYGQKPADIASDLKKLM